MFNVSCFRDYILIGFSDINSQDSEILCESFCDFRSQEIKNFKVMVTLNHIKFVPNSVNINDLL